jgi:hypothetical protein
LTLDRNNQAIAPARNGLDVPRLLCRLPERRTKLLDGRKIAFYSDRFNTPFSLDLITMNVDGSDIKRVITGIATCPDGGCGIVGWGVK